jgi:hypothetical protein
VIDTFFGLIVRHRPSAKANNGHFITAVQNYRAQQQGGDNKLNKARSAVFAVDAAIRLLFFADDREPHLCKYAFPVDGNASVFTYYGGDSDAAVLSADIENTQSIAQLQKILEIFHARIDINVSVLDTVRIEVLFAFPAVGAEFASVNSKHILSPIAELIY